MQHRRILDALETVAACHPDRWALTAIDQPDIDAPVRRWRHADLVADIRRAAKLFHQLADGQPARVALLLPPLPETHLALWGAETAGIACPINFQLNQAHIAELVRACGANILVALGPAPDLDIDAKVASLRADCPGLRHVLQVRAGPDQPLAPGQRDFAAELALQPGDRLVFAPPTDDSAALFHTGGTTKAITASPTAARLQVFTASQWGARGM